MDPFYWGPRRWPRWEEEALEWARGQKTCAYCGYPMPKMAPWCALCTIRKVVTEENGRALKGDEW